MDFSMTEESRMIQDAVRGWVTKECPRDRVLEWDETGSFPEDKFSSLAELGFCGMTVPEEFDGQGVNISGACLVLEELAAMSLPLSIQYASSAILGGALFTALGSSEQKKEYLPLCAQGQTLVASALGDPDDPCLPQPDAPSYSRDGSDYRINGSVKHVLLADQAGLLLTSAMDKTSEDGKWTIFVLEPGSGIKTEKLEYLGLRGADAFKAVFEDKAAKSDDILGGADFDGRGAEQWESISGFISLACAFQAVGTARGAFEYALDYSKQRIQFKQPIGRFPALREKLTEIETDIQASRLMALQAAWLADQGRPFARTAHMAKSLAVRTASHAGLDGLHILGGYGYTVEYDAQRYLRDSLGLILMGTANDNLSASLGAGLGL